MTAGQVSHQNASPPSRTCGGCRMALSAKPIESRLHLDLQQNRVSAIETQQHLGSGKFPERRPRNELLMHEHRLIFHPAARAAKAHAARPAKNQPLSRECLPIAKPFDDRIVRACPAARLSDTVFHLMCFQSLHVILPKEREYTFTHSCTSVNEKTPYARGFFFRLTSARRGWER